MNVWRRWIIHDNFLGENNNKNESVKTKRVVRFEGELVGYNFQIRIEYFYIAAKITRESKVLLVWGQVSHVGDQR